MSVNRENIVWQSAEGTWNRAFYDFYPVNQDDEDWDFEWDVEYTDEFGWLTVGHPSEQAAIDAWTGANPGGHLSIPYTPETAARCDALDAKAAEYKQKLPASGQRTWGYLG